MALTAFELIKPGMGVAWVFFRAESVGKALLYLYAAITNYDFSYGFGVKAFATTLFLILGSCSFEWIEENTNIFQKCLGRKSLGKHILYSLIFLAVLSRIDVQETFIYFQF